MFYIHKALFDDPNFVNLCNGIMSISLLVSKQFEKQWCIFDLCIFCLLLHYVRCFSEYPLRLSDVFSEMFEHDFFLDVRVYRIAEISLHGISFHVKILSSNERIYYLSGIIL